MISESQVQTCIDLILKEGFPGYFLQEGYIAQGVHTYFALDNHTGDRVTIVYDSKDQNLNIKHEVQDVTTVS